MAENEEKTKVADEEKAAQTKKRNPITWFVGAVQDNLALLSMGGMSIGAVIITVLTLLGLGVLLVAVVCALLLAINAVAGAVLLIINAIGGVVILLVAAILALCIALIVGAFSIPTIALYYISEVFNYSPPIWMYVAVLIVWTVLTLPAICKIIVKAMDK